MRIIYIDQEGRRISKVGKKNIGNPEKEYKVEIISARAAEIFKKKLKDVEGEIIGKVAD